MASKASTASARAAERRGFFNQSARTAASERRAQERAAEREQERAAEAALLAAEANYPPYRGEQFEDEANQLATAALLERLREHHPKGDAYAHR